MDISAQMSLFWGINKELALKIGVREAVLLEQIIELTDCYSSDYIYRTVDKLVEDTGFSKHEIRTFKKKLQELGLLEIEKRGMPAKHYMSVNFDKLESLIENY